MAPQLDEKTKLDVSLPVSVWMAGLVGYTTTVGAIVVAWVTLHGSIATVRDQQQEIRTTQTKQAEAMSSLANAVARLEGLVQR